MDPRSPSAGLGPSSAMHPRVRRGARGHRTNITLQHLTERTLRGEHISMLAELRRRIGGLIDGIESYQMPLGNWLLLLGAIIALRHFLEQLSGNIRTFHFVSYFIHYPLAYIAPILGLSVVISILSREKIGRVTKLMLVAWCLTLLPPIVDLVRPGITEIGYLFTESDGLGAAFVNLLNPAYNGFRGATLGIRVEAGLGCILAAFYVYLKTRSVTRSLITLPVIYSTMFFFFTFPTVVFRASQALGFSETDVLGMLFAEPGVHRGFAGITRVVLSQLTLSIADLFVIVGFALLWYRLYDRGRFAAASRLADPVRSGYHVFATLSGTILGTRIITEAPGLLGITNATDALAVAGVLAASFFAALAGSALAKLHDATGKSTAADRRTASAFGGVCFALGCLFALSVSYVALTYVIALAATYYLCFAPPLRLGRFGPARALLFGAATLFSVELGFSTHAGANAALWMPRTLVVLCILVPGLALTAVRLRLIESTRGAPTNPLAVRSRMGIALVAALAACLLPGVALELPTLTIAGAIVGLLAALAVVRATSVPRVLIAFGSLGFAILIVAQTVSAPGSPRILSDLGATSFPKAATTPAAAVARNDEARTAFERAHACRAADDLEGEREALELTVALDPENGVAQVLLGDLYLGTGSYEEAVEAYETSLDGRDSVERARTQLAQALYLAGDLLAAEATLREDAVERPHSPSPHANLARLLMESGRTEEARSELEKAVSLARSPDLKATFEAQLSQLDAAR